MKAVNLLPPELRGAAKPAAGAVSEPNESGRVGAFALLGALAFCVVALAGYVLTTNTVKQREVELAEVTAEAQATAQRAAQLKPYADFEAMARTRIQTVKDLAASRFDWEQALRDISRAIPASVTLKKLNGTVSSQSGGGSPLRAAIGSPALELTGCTANQTAVATLMSRLRNVDGVTRVTLARSEKPTKPSSTSSGPVVTDGCGQGRKPAFELVIFFERSEVPATVEDVTVQPAAATAGETAPADGTAPAEGADGTVPADPADGTVPAEGADGTPASTTTGAG